MLRDLNNKLNLNDWRKEWNWNESYAYYQITVSWLSRRINSSVQYHTNCASLCGRRNGHVLWLRNTHVIRNLWRVNGTCDWSSRQGVKKCRQHITNDQGLYESEIVICVFASHCQGYCCSESCAMFVWLPVNFSYSLKALQNFVKK